MADKLILLHFQSARNFNKQPVYSLDKLIILLPWMTKILEQQMQMWRDMQDFLAKLKY